jgi:hypothetical protein
VIQGPLWVRVHDPDGDRTLEKEAAWGEMNQRIACGARSIFEFHGREPATTCFLVREDQIRKDEE